MQLQSVAAIKSLPVKLITWNYSVHDDREVAGSAAHREHRAVEGFVLLGLLAFPCEELEWR